MYNPIYIKLKYLFSHNKNCRKILLTSVSSVCNLLVCWKRFIFNSSSLQLSGTCVCVCVCDMCKLGCLSLQCKMMIQTCISQEGTFIKIIHVFLFSIQFGIPWTAISLKDPDYKTPELVVHIPIKSHHFSDSIGRWRMIFCNKIRRCWRRRSSSCSQSLGKWVSILKWLIQDS
jgi:hypothetical protein